MARRARSMQDARKVGLVAVLGVVGLALVLWSLRPRAAELPAGADSAPVAFREQPEPVAAGDAPREAATAASSRTIAPDAVPGWVEVRDAATREPLPFATVELLDRRGDAVQRLITDAAGRIELPRGEPPAGGVLCHKPGYRLAGRPHLLDGSVIALEPAGELRVELVNVPERLRSWRLRAEVRYPRFVAAAHAIGNPRLYHRIEELSDQAEFAADLALLALRIDERRELAVVGLSPDGGSEELACQPVSRQEDRVVIDLGNRLVEHFAVKVRVAGLGKRHMTPPRFHPVQSSNIELTGDAPPPPHEAADHAFDYDDVARGDYWVEFAVLEDGGAPWRSKYGPFTIANDRTIDIDASLRTQVVIEVAGTVREWAEERTAMGVPTLTETVGGGRAGFWHQAFPVLSVKGQQVAGGVRQVTERRIELAQLQPGRYRLEVVGRSHRGAVEFEIAEERSAMIVQHLRLQMEPGPGAFEVR